MSKFSKHPDKKQLIEYILNSSNKATEDIRNHVNECEECKRVVVSMQSILEKSANTDICPSDHVEREITEFLNNQQNTKKISDSISIRKIILRPALALVIVLCIISLFFTFNYFKSSPGSENIYFALSNFKGKVYYDSDILQKGISSINKGSIFTENNSSVVLKLDNYFSINIAENTELTIKTAIKEKNNNDYIYILDFKLKTGNIYAEWNDHNKHKSFTISTKYAHFKAMGTSFILSERKKLSRLSVIKGRVQATSPESGKKFIINPGEGFISNRASRKIKINAEYEIRRFEEIFTGNEYKPGKNIAIQESGKKAEEKKNINLNKKQKKQATAIKNKESLQMRKEKKEMLKDSRKIQREMRRNIRSNKKSRR